MLTWTHPAVVIGTGLALGSSLTFLVCALPLFRRPTLADRIAPYLRSNTALGPHVYAPAAPTAGGMGGLLRGLITDSARWAARRLTTDTSIQTRLARLGPGATVEGFRARQILCIVAGLLAGAVLAGLVSFSRGFHPLLALALIVLGGAAGHLGNDWWLTQRVKRREERILAEFPTIAELLSLSIMAGEGTVDALQRVCRTASGELSGELAGALAAARTGTGLVEALDTMARRTGIPSLVQFVDGIAIAIARGTPLAEVLRAQAADVREEGRRSLMELSGKKEVGMLVPVVMFVLPVTVVFAVYPSLAVLNLGG
ncbi:type II secretion system F family protein [Brevibacterium sp. 50QC2O2]|uniref:type II secretion system F family protein n=1 Tax=Brevibacterium TaxID=1696 RepID=UPI00211CB94E|nr:MULTISPECIES: type II secretion system F family protein [unclassified Brevibacterium]MCQ9384663.1 type II secretion system F family protein [Brevibacterium sp. 68QC2CO]MCQ9389249.1 type II secretion system F family protein [Brevibacterium sp. 50QC2O2]